MKATAISLVAVVVVVGIALAGLRFVSAHRAESGCSVEAERRGYSSISGYDWSWSPLGTSCTFDGRVTETRLFW